MWVDFVGGFSRALHKPNGDPAPLARSSQMSKGRDLFCTSLFAQVGQEVSFIAGSSYHHDCLSATDSIRQPGPLYTGNESDEYRSKAPITFTFSHSQIKLPTGEKSNKCNQCDYASSRADSLRAHLKTHSGKKSNKCSQ